MFSISSLAETQAAMGNEVFLFTTNSNGKEDLNVPVNMLTNVDGVNVVYFKRLAGFTEFSFPLISKVLKDSSNYSIIHLHSWWNFNILVIAWILTLKKQKFVFSPRGMLSTYSFKYKSEFLKKAVFYLFSKPVLKKNRIHVTSENEKKDISNLLEGCSPLLLPNVFNFPSFRIAAQQKTQQKLGLQLLFLSRIDPVKGLDVILKSLACLQRHSIPFYLTIAGTGNLKYIEELKHEAAKLNVGSSIDWIGHADSKTKANLFGVSDLLLLPSYSENFANVVLESLYYGLPVMVTRNVGLYEYVEQNDFGYIVNQDENELARCCLDFLKRKEEWYSKKSEMHKKVCRDFDKEAIVKKYLKYYESVLEK